MAEDGGGGGVVGVLLGRGAVIGAGAAAAAAGLGCLACYVMSEKETEHSRRLKQERLADVRREIDSAVALSRAAAEATGQPMRVESVRRTVDFVDVDGDRSRVEMRAGEGGEKLVWTSTPKDAASEQAAAARQVELPPGLVQAVGVADGTAAFTVDGPLLWNPAQGLLYKEEVQCSGRVQFYGAQPDAEGRRVVEEACEMTSLGPQVHLPRAESFATSLLASISYDVLPTEGERELLRRAAEFELCDALERTAMHRAGRPGHGGYADGQRLTHALGLAEAIDASAALRPQRRCGWARRQCDVVALVRRARRLRPRMFVIDDRLGERAQQMLDRLKAERRRGSGMQRVMHMWLPSLPQYVVGVALGTTSSALTPAMLASMTGVVDVAKDHAGRGDEGGAGGAAIRRAALSCCGVWLVKVFLNSAGQVFTERSTSRFQLKLKDAVLQSVVKQDMAFFDKYPAAKLQGKISYAVDTSCQQLFDVPAQFLSAAAQVVMSARTVLRDAPRLFVPCVAPIPFAVCFFGVVASCFADDRVDSVQGSEATLLHCIQTVRTHAQEREEVERQGALRAEDRRSAARSNFVQTCVWHGMEGVVGSGALGMYYVGAQMVLVGRMEAGKLQGLQFIATSLLPSIVSLLYSGYKMVQVMSPLRKAAELLDARPTIERVEGPAPLPPAAPQPPPGAAASASPPQPRPATPPEPLPATALLGKIEFRDVKFAYPTSISTSSRRGVSDRAARAAAQDDEWLSRQGTGAEFKPTLNGLNFVVEPGQQLAIVGRRGCGKSTVCKLIMRLYDPDDGEIFVDDQPLKRYDLQQLRRNIAIVAQDAVLIGDTVRDAVCYGVDPKPSDAEIEAACKEANAWEFIGGGGVFNDQLNTRLRGPDAVVLSGGQRQCIAIARALVRKPAILLLDEATSSLDSVSERRVQEGLDNLRSKKWIRSSVTIAHRLHTIMAAHRIVVVQDGIAAETGTHSELFQKTTVFSPGGSGDACTSPTSASAEGEPAPWQQRAVRGIYHHMWDMQARADSGAVSARMWALQEKLEVQEQDNRKLRADLKEAREKLQQQQQKGGLVSGLLGR